MTQPQNNELYIQKLKKRIAELEDRLRTDELTRILNRRGLMEYLETITTEVIFQLKYPERRRFLLIKYFSLVFVDLDHFKNINDSYGHQMGDEVLRRVTALIRDELRGIDIVGRYGGEEIVIGLIGADRQAASEIANGIRQKIARLDFKHEDSVFHLTASFGVASLDNGMSLKELIAQADTAVYRAKHKGRNCVVTYGDEPDDNLSALPKQQRSKS